MSDEQQTTPLPVPRPALDYTIAEMRDGAVSEPVAEVWRLLDEAITRGKNGSSKS